MPLNGWRYSVGDLSVLGSSHWGKSSIHTQKFEFSSLKSWARANRKIFVMPILLSNSNLRYLKLKSYLVNLMYWRYFIWKKNLDLMFSLKVSSGRKSDKSEANTNFKANLKLGMYLLFDRKSRSISQLFSLSTWSTQSQHFRIFMNSPRAQVFLGVRFEV